MWGGFTCIRASQVFRLLSPNMGTTQLVSSTDGSTVSVNSGEGCVTKCGANFLNSSGRLTFARSPAKPVLTFVYTYYSSTRYILSKETHRISQRNDTFNTQFPKLTTIRCKFSCVEGHVTKYCYYVMFDTIGHVAKIPPNMHSGLLNCFRHVQYSKVPRPRPRCAE